MIPPEAVQALLDELVALCRQRFPQRLESVYLLGSLAHGGFSPGLSDVDVCILLRDPLEDGDGPALVDVSGELAERFPRFGPRVSLFWCTRKILRGEQHGGRLGPLDAVDLAQNGMKIWGEELGAEREAIRPRSREEIRAAMYADMADRWRRELTPFAGRRLLETGQGAELDERSLVKACLYPARFLYTAESGRVGSADEAVEAFAARHGEKLAAPLRLAQSLRQRGGSGVTAEEKQRLADAFRPLYAMFFGDISKKYGLEGLLE